VSEVTYFDKPPHDDPAFVAAWCKMEDDGYIYSESNVAKVHLGWLLAHRYMLSDLAQEARFLLERLNDFAQEHTEGYREWNGHVVPSISRLDSILKEIECE